MPRPVIDLGWGCPRLWFRPEVEEWAAPDLASIASDTTSLVCEIATWSTFQSAHDFLP
jgi:hypothetical protein